MFLLGNIRYGAENKFSIIQSRQKLQEVKTILRRTIFEFIYYSNSFFGSNQYNINFSDPYYIH